MNLSSKYPSKNHPRGLQLAVYAASDAVRSMGIGWQDLLARVPADRIAVYASSAMGQLDLGRRGRNAASKPARQAHHLAQLPLWLAANARGISSTHM